MIDHLEKSEIYPDLQSKHFNIPFLDYLSESLSNRRFDPTYPRDPPSRRHSSAEHWNQTISPTFPFYTVDLNSMDDIIVIPGKESLLTFFR